MSEVFITYQITISEEELDIITGIVESYKEDNPGFLSVEDAIITGILEQIRDSDGQEQAYLHTTPNKE